MTYSSSSYQRWLCIIGGFWMVWVIASTLQEPLCSVQTNLNQTYLSCHHKAYKLSDPNDSLSVCLPHTTLPTYESSIRLAQFMSGACLLFLYVLSYLKPLSGSITLYFRSYFFHFFHKIFGCQIAINAP